MNQIEKIKAEIERLYDKASKSDGEYRNGAQHALITLKDFIESLEKEQEGLHFTPLGRLIQKLPWNDSTNSYAKKLVDCLVREGYIKDAQIVQGIVSYKNGNNIPMATMDEVHIQFNDERMLKKERENKGYDESYLKEKIALATKNGSWRESPEKEKSEIPSNSPSVDDAAEAHRRKVFYGDPDYSRLLRETSKAGAEWMAKQGWIDDGSMPPETKHEGNTMQAHIEWTESKPVLAWDSMYGPCVDVTKNGKWMSEQRGGYTGQVCHGIIAWRPIPEYKEKQ